MQTCQEPGRRKGKLVRSGPFKWTGLPEEPMLRTYLPPNYDQSDDSYPLAIFFDGQNLFDDAGSFRGGWQLHRLIDWRSCRGAKVPIVAALETNGASRSDILSPWSHDGIHAKADQTLNWLTEWFIPSLRRQYRISAGPQNVVIGGSSLGGLMALYAFGRKPDTFGNVIAMSPSIGLPGGRLGQIHDFFKQAELPISGRKVYIDAGAKECECTSIMHHSGILADLLENKGYRAHRELLFFADPDGAHDEQSWKRRLPGALDFVLGH